MSAARPGHVLWMPQQRRSHLRQRFNLVGMHGITERSNCCADNPATGDKPLRGLKASFSTENLQVRVIEARAGTKALSAASLGIRQTGHSAMPVTRLSRPS